MAAAAKGLPGIRVSTISELTVSVSHKHSVVIQDDWKLLACGGARIDRADLPEALCHTGQRDQHTPSVERGGGVPKRTVQLMGLEWSW